MEELQAQDVTGVILLGTFGMLLLVGSMGLFVLMYQKRVLKEKQDQARRELLYQNQMIQLQLESQENERKRIGADLHDSLGSLLWGAKVNASFIQRSAMLSGESLTSYNELIQILDDSIHAMRRISWELSPEAFQYTGLTESVKKLCQQFNGKGVAIQFQETGHREWNTLEALQVFRIIQELVSNAVKHSKASSILVSLAWDNEFLLVHVQDDGVGFILDKKRKGIGWWNIEQRVKQLQASITIGETPSLKGTHVFIKIPLAHG
jgi:signal transduction histidine kinase